MWCSASQHTACCGAQLAELKHLKCKTMSVDKFCVVDAAYLSTCAPAKAAGGFQGLVATGVECHNASALQAPLIQVLYIAMY